MKKTLRHCDIKEGRKYRVIKLPVYWPHTHTHSHLGKIGLCKHVSINAVGLIFDGTIYRSIQPHCLEEAEEEMPVKEIKTNKTLNSENVEIDAKYKVIEVPAFWKENVSNHDYPALNKIGKIKRKMGNGCLMYFSSPIDQHWLPYDCIEKVPVVEIEDDYLIKRMRINPHGVLKLVKGLVKMNKDVHLLNFLEQGII